MLSKLTVYVWWVSVPLHAWVADAEAVSVGQWGRQVDAVDLRARLDVVHIVQPARGSEDIGVSACTDL